MSEAILYIDPDEGARQRFQTDFVESFRVVCAADHETAESALLQHDPAVVVTHARGADEGPLEVLGAFAERHGHVIRLLLVTEPAPALLKSAVNVAAAWRVVEAPWTRDELAEALRDGLDTAYAEARLKDFEQRLQESDLVYALRAAAARLGHELRNPLGLVTGNIQLAEWKVDELWDELARSLPDREKIGAALEELRELLKESLYGADGLRTVIDRIHSGGGIPAEEIEAVDLPELIQVTVRRMHLPRRVRSRIRMSFQPVPAVRGSRARLTQLIEKTVRYALGVAGTSVSLTLARDESYVRLECEGSGDLIPPDDPGLIFDPIYMATRSGAPGLYPSITRRIVRELGGEIAVEGLRGVSSRIVVKLPAVAMAAS